MKLPAPIIFASHMRKIPALVIFAAAITAAAQPGGRGFDDGTVVTTTFKPKLIPSGKLLIDPVIPRATNAPLNIDYLTQDFRWNTRKITRILPPARHFEPGIDTSYNPNYARAGGGNYSHKLLELYLANRANTKWAYNAAFQHLSADENATLRDFSTNRAFITGARFFKRSSLEMRLSYMRDMNRFFAKDTIWKGDLAETRKIGQNTGFNLLYDQKAQGKKPGFSAGFMFNNFFNNLKQSETEFGGRFGWDAKIQKMATRGTLEVTNLQFRQNFTSTRQWFIDLMPRVLWTNKENAIDINAGLNLSWVFKDTGSPLFYLNPFVLAEKKLEGLKMKLYGGLDGGLRRNSIRRFFETVPFTYDSIRIYNSYEQLKVFAGLKGRITENSQFNVEFGNSTMAYMPLIVTNNDSIRSLQIVYDDVNNLYFSADVRLSIGEKLRVGATGRFNNYTTKNELQAWHLPAFNYSLTGQYNLNRKFIFQLGVDGMSRRYNKVLDVNNQLDLKGFADLHARVDFILKDMVRFWVQGSNLLNMKYQTWFGYNNYRTTIMGGLAASF